MKNNRSKSFELGTRLRALVIKTSILQTLPYLSILGPLLCLLHPFFCTVSIDHTSILPSALISFSDSVSKSRWNTITGTQGSNWALKILLQSSSSGVILDLRGLQIFLWIGFEQLFDLCSLGMELWLISKSAWLISSEASKVVLKSNGTYISSCSAKKFLFDLIICWSQNVGTLSLQHLNQVFRIHGNLWIKSWLNSLQLPNSRCGSRSYQIIKNLSISSFTTAHHFDYERGRLSLEIEINRTWNALPNSNTSRSTLHRIGIRVVFKLNYKTEFIVSRCGYLSFYKSDPIKEWSTDERFSRHVNWRWFWTDWETEIKRSWFSARETQLRA